MPPAGRDSRQLLDGLIDRVEHLHSSPLVACKVLNLLKDPEFDVRQVEKQLETDPALAAAILRLVNSSCFGLAQKVSSLRQAITLLGARSLRLTVLSFGLVGRLTWGAPGKVCSDYWRRALTMATTASLLSAGRDAVRPDEAYSAGLLADVGVLALAQLNTEQYVSLYQRHRHGRRLVEAERAEFGFDHCTLGAQLLARWSLPKKLTGAVFNHHAKRPGRGVLALSVLAGDILADVLWEPETPRLPEAQRLLLGQFGLDLDGFISLALKCKSDIAENADLFHVELVGSINCDALMEKALHLYKQEAIATAMDLDSLTAIMDHDCAPT
jgi:HD-like signal output (HDOD) protein